VRPYVGRERVLVGGTFKGAVQSGRETGFYKKDICTKGEDDRVPPTQGGGQW